ncbi:YbaB/EbfC family nucleoid-associated protein, partial [bacterium]|nr:YbaB/EbfC family nucleoid-associated protein [bacterium]
MRQAQEVQKKMQKIQEDMANTEFEGSAGGGVVKAVITGSGAAKKIWIDDSVHYADRLFLPTFIFQTELSP